MSEILSANLPKNSVKVAAIDSRYIGILQKPLKDAGLEHIISIPQSNNLEKPVCAHPDMLMCHVGKSEIVIEPQLYDRCAHEFTALGLNPIRGNTDLKIEYPYNIANIAYNAAIIDTTVVHRISSTDMMIKIGLQGHNFINVKQGYSKCSVCIVGKNAVITADRGIANALSSMGTNVLQISPGFIDLKGYDYGFIGGSCGLIGNSRLAFTGVLDGHPQKAQILAFLKEHNVEPVYLTNERIFDIGSIIPLIEE